MISKAHFPKFRVGEVLQFLYDALSLCEDHDPEKLQILTHINELREATTNLDEIYKIAQGSPITAEVVDTDEQRDKGITGIKMCAESFTYHFDAAVRQAAVLIVKSIDMHGKNIPRQNLQAETNTLNDIESSWTSKPELVAALAKLSLTSWAGELKRLNDLFNNKYLSRAKESATLPEETTLEERRAAIEAYRKVTAAINAHATLATPGTYTVLVKELNAIIDKYNTLVDNRGEDDDKGPAPKNT